MSWGNFYTEFMILDIKFRWCEAIKRRIQHPIKHLRQSLLRKLLMLFSLWQFLQKQVSTFIFNSKKYTCMDAFFENQKSLIFGQLLGLFRSSWSVTAFFLKSREKTLWKKSERNWWWFLRNCIVKFATEGRNNLLFCFN